MSSARDLKTIYLDHAASSHPKAPGVVEAVSHALTKVGANPGRSGHRLSLQAASFIFEARENLASLLGVKDARRILLGSGCTWALNTVLAGHLRHGDHVVTTPMEHNSVMRPLRHLQRSRGVRLDVARADPWGRLEPGALREACQADTRLVVINHASNVNGVLQDLQAIRSEIPELPLLVDAAQTTGCVPIDVDGLNLDFLAFSGHKGLLGPQGTGGLAMGPGRDLPALIRGGTGSRSEEEEQPDFLPDSLEAGTPNTPGLAGLAASSRWLADRGVDAIRAHELALSARLREGLVPLDGLKILSPTEDHRRVATLAVRLSGQDAGDLARVLERDHGILLRAGLQCAPAAHRHLGSAPDGTLRLAPGPFSTEAEMDSCIAAFRAISRSR